MTTAALLDLVQIHGLDLGLVDGNSTTLRARILARAQEVAEAFWDFYDWDFKYGVGTVAVPASASIAAAVIDAPADFFTLGDDGHLWVSGQKRKIDYKVPRELFRLREAVGSMADYPDYFTVSTATPNAATPGTQVPRFYFYPGNNLAFTLNVDNFMKKAPVLVDSTTATNKLDSIPEDYHRSIIQRGVMKLMGFDGGDGRAETYDVWFRREAARAKARRVQGRADLQMLGQEGGLHTFGMH